MIGFELSRLMWRKSSHSSSEEGSSCVEVASVPPRMIATRDSKDPYGPALCFTAAEWSGFLGRIRHGSYDL